MAKSEFMQYHPINRVFKARPDLLDAQRVEVRVIKDPSRPLSVVSELGVVYGGLEVDSSIYRLSDGISTYIVKQHYNITKFRRERANIRFLNMAETLAPEIMHDDEEAGLLVLEDLGDWSLAVLWKDGNMSAYERWVHEVAAMVVDVDVHFRRHADQLYALYRPDNPEAAPKRLSAEQLVGDLDASLRVSRGTTFSANDREALLDVAHRWCSETEHTAQAWRGFVLDLQPGHILCKGSRLRILDFTFQPVGSLIGQFQNIIWHLKSRRQILKYYLDARERRGLPILDRHAYLRAADWMNVMKCVLWIRLYCRDILLGERFLTGLDGGRLDDYAGSEMLNLESIHRSLEPYSDLRVMNDILRQAFAPPLRQLSASRYSP